jgi:serine/threonine-protein kinase
VTPSRVHGRYALYDALGAGAAASVYLGVSRGPPVVPVAIKRLHDGVAREAAAVNRLLDEVRLARHVVHPNVVRVLDFVSDGVEMLAVMEYVHGEPLSRLLTGARSHMAGGPSGGLAVPLDVVRTILDSDGKPLGMVHRDVTPENVLVGVDGIARLMDFGIAKAEGRLHATRDGGVKGKIAYLAPEQVGGDVTRRSDLYAAGLVLWEMLVGERALEGDNEAAVLVQALDPKIPPPSSRARGISSELDAVVMRALCIDPNGRFATAAELAEALGSALGGTVDHAAVSAWMHTAADERLAERGAALEAILAEEEVRAAASMPRVATPGIYGSGSVEVPLHELMPSGEAAVAPAGNRRSYAGVLVMLGAASLVVAVGMAWRARGEGDAVGVETVPASASVRAAASVVEAVVETAPSGTARPSVSATASVAPVEAAPSAAPSAEAAPSSTVRAVGSARGPKVVRPPSAKCDPPWVIDSHGIRRYDPACAR